MVFTTGADRCRALADIAREKEHEVKLLKLFTLPIKNDVLPIIN